jgi:hypothetical protein
MSRSEHRWPSRSARRLALYAPHIGEDPLAARRRHFGAAWVDGIEEIRRRIPEDGAYVLVDAQPVEQGAHYWARHDLAPRRALFLGRAEELPAPRRLRGSIPRRIRWAVVVTAADRPPRLLTLQELSEEASRLRER